MNNKQTLKQAKQLIKNNRVDKALELLSETFNNSEFNNEIIQDTNNFNDYKKKERLSVISLSDANTFKNQIVAALLGLVDDIEIGKKSGSKESEVEKPAQQVINIINSKNVNTGNINTDGGDFKIGDNYGQKANQIKPYIEVDLILLLSSSTQKEFCRISNKEHKKDGEYFFQSKENQFLIGNLDGYII